MSIHDFKANLRGKEVPLSEYDGKVVLIVNTASKCGFTPQYDELQKLYETYSDRGFVVLGFPSNQFAEQEPGTNDEIQEFCRINYGVEFPVFDKIDVRGDDAHPLFKYLTSEAPFRGFDMSHPIGPKLQEVLQGNFPELLEGDSVKWNFTKFLIDKQGKVVGRFEPTTAPMDIAKNIEALL